MASGKEEDGHGDPSIMHVLYMYLGINIFDLIWNWIDWNLKDFVDKICVWDFKGLRTKISESEKVSNLKSVWFMIEFLSAKTFCTSVFDVFHEN